ncbi:MAG TPA: ATP-grasp domain-containing protein, partial [Burkholderiaceae bacterium]|nr:ATP-grasp domain-containing protein [Burkholderiaceae bacterium]
LARDQAGKTAVYPVLRNVHRDGILAITTLADDLPGAMIAQAHEAATTIAQQLDYVGVLCVEFFVLQDGQLVVNEVAPRPHNSGHITMDACQCSQFEQQVRVLAGQPLGSISASHGGVMLNILGDIWFPPGSETPIEPDWNAVLAVPQAHLHLYGKQQVRRGRKMGHVNLTAADMAQVNQAAQQVAGILGIAWNHD